MRELGKRRQPIPMLIGSGKDEWTAMSIFIPYLFTGKIPDDLGTASFITDQMIPSLIDEKNWKNPVAIKEAVAYQYATSVPPQNIPYFWNFRATDIMSDNQMYGPLTRDIEDFLGSGSTVFVYSLDHLSRNDPVYRQGSPFTDLVPHGWDVQYLYGSRSDTFDQLISIRTGGTLNYTVDDHYVMDLFQTAFTNFAKTGTPTPLPRSNVQWDPVPLGSPVTNYTYLSISTQPRMEESYHARAATFWNKYVMKIEERGDGASNERESTTKDLLKSIFSFLNRYMNKRTGQQ